MEKINQEIRQIFLSKETRRQNLAKLPYPEKVKIVVHLQEMANPIFRNRGKLKRVWKLD